MCVQGSTIAEEEDDPLLAKHRNAAQRHKKEVALEQSAETTTIKKLHVSSANLQRVGGTWAPWQPAGRRCYMGAMATCRVPWQPEQAMIGCCSWLCGMFRVDCYVFPLL